MVLVSFVLVVVAAITLVIGLLQSGLAIIYVSIACSVLAGIVLATAVLRGRPEPRSAGAPMPQPTPASAPPPAPADTWVAPGQSSTPLPAPQPVSAGALAAGTVAVAESDDRTESLARVDVGGGGPSDDFPIHDYDTLRATEILPMLAALSDDQLDAVDERERNGKSRAMVLNRINAQRQSRAAEPTEEPDEWDADDEGWDVGVEPEPEPAIVVVSAPDEGEGPMSQRPVAPAVGEFPIPDFDDLKALEVLGRLPDLSVTELHLVRRREEDGFRRAMVLNRIDRLIEEAPPEPEPIVVVPPRRRATARTATKDTPAKRSGIPAPAARKAPPSADVAAAVPAKRTRTATPASAGRAAATPAPAKKATTRKATTRKASTRKASTRKASTREATTRKATATTRKAVAESRPTTAKKVASTRKATPAKRATKKR